MRILKTTLVLVCAITLLYGCLGAGNTAMNAEYHCQHREVKIDYEAEGAIDVSAGFLKRWLIGAGIEGEGSFSSSETKYIWEHCTFFYHGGDGYGNSHSFDSNHVMGNSVHDFESIVRSFENCKNRDDPGTPLMGATGGNNGNLSVSHTTCISAGDDVPDSEFNPQDDDEDDEEDDD